MAEDESYEIMPYKEIVSLKKELESLKRNSSSDDVTDTLSRISKSMDSMVQLFHQASEELAAEETTEEKFEKKLKPILDRLNEIIDQNKIIAEGMVAIADIVKKQNSPMQRPMMAPPPVRPMPPQPPMDMQQFNNDYPSFSQSNDNIFRFQGGQMPPPPGSMPGGMPPPPGPMPPMPDLGQPKKKGLFGR